MPSRTFAFLIVASWMLMTGWLVWTDLLPRLMPGSPPPFAILLIEEADQQRPPTRWVASRNGQKAFAVQTRVTRRGSEEFELSATYSPFDPPDVQGKQAAPVSLDGLLVSRMASSYRVNAEGDLLGLAVVVEARPEPGNLFAWLVNDFVARIEGDSVAGVMRPRATVDVKGHRLERDLGETVVPRRGGTVLMPLHPVNRVGGLRPGQRWTLTLFDPLGNLKAFSLGHDSAPPLLHAVVRPELEARGPDHRRLEPCFVIDYTGEGMTASTWVREKDGLVLLQTAKVGKDEWQITRE